MYIYIYMYTRYNEYSSEVADHVYEGCHVVVSRDNYTRDPRDALRHLTTLHLARSS